MFIRTPDEPGRTAIKEKGTRKRKLSMGAVSAMMIVPDWRAPFMPKRSPISSLSLAMASAGSESATTTRACWAIKPRILTGSPGRASGFPIGTHHESMFHEMEVRPHAYLGSSRKLVFGRLRTFEEFPPMQEVASWSTDRIMTKMINQGRNGNRVPATASHHLLPGEAIPSIASSGAPREMSDRQAATNIV